MDKKKVVHFLSDRFPSYFGNKIYKNVLNPQVKKLREHELAMLNCAEKSTYSILNYSIQGYKWGNGSQDILLIHGWEGQAGNFTDIIEALLKADYTVYAYDAPGHGYSSGGGEVMFDFHEVARQMINQLKVKKIISHSFGSVATSYSLAKMPDYVLDKCVMITTPSSFATNVSNLCYRMGLSRRAINNFYGRVQDERAININDLNVAKFVQQINVKKALILHDVNDKIIPFKESQRVAEKWKEAKLRPIQDTGHFRILRTPAVTDQVIEFLHD